MTNIETIKDFFPSEILAVTTNRNNGYSDQGFKSFNLSLSVNDSIDTVKKNRFLLQQKIKSDIVWMNQSHSTNVEFINKYSQLVNADGIVSSNTNFACSVLTADCLPILACTSRTKIIGAVHVGWRGLSSGILQNFYNRILRKHLVLCDKKNSTANSSVFVWMGPSICEDCYEVGSEVKANFYRSLPENSKFFEKTDNDKWKCNLKLIAKFKTLEFFKDINDISLKINIDKRCTHCDKNIFFSFRRDGVTGRMASLIKINK